MSGLISRRKIIEYFDVTAGVVGNGITDDTAALLKANEHCVENGLQIVLTKPAYKISGPILNPTARTGARTLNIKCLVPTIIIVDPAATAFNAVAYLMTTAYESNFFLSGAALTIDGSNKAAIGIRVDNTSTVDNVGIVDIDSNLIIKNLKKNNSGTTENGGLSINGPFSSIHINKTEVDQVDRIDTEGACFGIAISGFTGNVTINKPKISRILCTGFNTDADGIKTFGKNPGDQEGADYANNARLGTVTINEPEFQDCQGRFVKSQCSKTTVNNPKVKRQYVQAITSIADFEFQKGNGLLIDPDIEYKKNGATSPISASHGIVTFANGLNNEPMLSRCIRGVVKTEVAFTRIAYLTYTATGLFSEVEVSGMKIIASGALLTAGTKAITDALLDVDMTHVVAKPGKTRLIIKDVTGPIGSSYAIGYRGYISGDLSEKLSYSATGLKSTVSLSSDSFIFGEFANNRIGLVESFLMNGNVGFKDSILAPAHINFTKLTPGSCFTVDADTVIATNAPPWVTNATTFAFIECLSQRSTDGARFVRVTVENGVDPNTHFTTRDGGVNWGSNATLSATAASIAAIGSNINTVNKTAGRNLWDTTNNRLMVASGATPSSPWYLADGSVSVTPA